MNSAPPNPLTHLSLEQLRTRTSRKWRTYPSDVLPLWIAEMDVLPAEPIGAAIRAALHNGDTGYPAGGEYARAFARFAYRRWAWRIDTEQIFSMPDVMRGMVELLRLVTDHGDALVVTNPVYPPFYTFARHAGRRIIEAPLDDAGRLDLETLRLAFVQARAGEARGAMLLSNPHNPTGTVHTREELTALAALAKEHCVRVISDEIHAPLVLPGAEFTPYLTVPSAENAFSLISASKGWNLAGIKAALAIAGSESQADLHRLPAEVALGASHLGNIAHAAAFEHGEPWLDSLLQGLDYNRRYLTQLLRHNLPDVRFREPEATFLAWLDFCASLPEIEDISPYLIEHARVALNPGAAFGGGGAGFVRLNYATNPKILDAAVQRIADAVSERAS